MIHKLIFDTTDADTRAATHTVGAILYDGVNDRLGVINASSELQVRDDDANTTLTSIETELTSITHVEDSAHASGDVGSMALAVRNDTEGSLVDTDGDYAPLQVDALGRLRVIGDLDITNLSEKDEDAAHSSGDTGDYVLAVRSDARPTNANTDADGDYASFFVNTNGELYVKSTDTDALLTALSKSEDAAHSSGDQGIMGLAVRSDTLAALAGTDGDYTPLQVDANGALYVNVDDSFDAALADTAIATAANALDVANTAEDLVASPLANRKYLYAYNNGNKEAYIGATGVTAATGFPIYPGSILELRAGPSIDIEWVAADTNQEMRTLELA